MTSRTHLVKASTLLVATAAAAITAAGVAGAAPAPEPNPTATFPASWHGWEITVVNDTDAALNGIDSLSNAKSITPTFAAHGGTGQAVGTVTISSEGALYHVVTNNLDFRLARDTNTHQDGVNISVRKNNDGSGRLECKSDESSSFSCDNTTVDASTKSAEIHIHQR
ncbi:hypothetical protein LQL77_30270 [Rhodococcus cerastii]|nr:hypothetical protein [Rhodococcus cerastii]